MGADFKPITDIVLDHVSASWATDENFTMSGHIDRVHPQYCLIAEGLDYPNPKQTLIMVNASPRLAPPKDASRNHGAWLLARVSKSATNLYCYKHHTE